MIRFLFQSLFRKMEKVVNEVEKEDEDEPGSALLAAVKSCRESSVRWLVTAPATRTLPLGVVIRIELAATSDRIKELIRSHVTAPRHKEYRRNVLMLISSSAAGNEEEIERLLALPHFSLADIDVDSVSDALSAADRNGHVAIARRISKGEFERYEATRDELFAETTRLSVYLKFGCVGVREVFRAVVQAHGVGHALIRQLFWRAFYDQVAYHFPGVLAGQVTPGKSNESLNRKYDEIRWVSSQPLFDAWCAGRTGFPIVDAGMRQLLATGYMHNRVRMVSANFLVKVLHIDWRLGERFFAQNLVDYDPSSNSGGWQWASGGGADSQQYYRVFSPWLQAEHHDPGCVYIKRHIPELSTVPVADILAWHSAHVKHSTPYPPPIVADYRVEAKRSMAMYKKNLN
ncbi:Deoxyribodipyrimidine photo-lyase [Tetrabaena socialis]|uniref:Deoxyribodipyrimidine photo-lyase n=1 Tax=Tetrabaena socialis TaxID=47790 RepID=A0A2J7ZW07_9CHLO|nr:Deoxyribodipyrimidine photo-lyase [Tetrabaena socialis]|eukprot:PNH04446.1 Deoxyribodipyrimidine photo-lyase [Tetrabaena socialis]